MKHVILTASCAASVAAAASGGSIFWFAQGAGGPIIDLPGGAQTTFTTDVAPSGINFAPLVVYLDVEHSWVGDLTITLEHDGVAVTLLDRLGVPGSPTGSNDDLDGVYLLTSFGFSPTLDAFDNAGSDSLIPPGFYQLDNADGSSLDDFLGQDLFGEWRLTVGDAVFPDAGILREWRVGYIVPAPAGASLLALAGLSAARRRRP